jgi:hypothetical protein
VWEEASIYNYFRQMLAFRNRTKAFAYGSYEDLDPQNPNIFAYTFPIRHDVRRPRHHQFACRRIIARDIVRFSPEIR